jgi:hypothetical protein
LATVPPEDAGAAGGVLQTMQQVGATLGLAILVTVFGTASHNAAGAGATVQSALVNATTEAFVTSAILATVTFAVALTFRRQER